MQVRILYFAAVAELVGTQESSVELPDTVQTVGAFAEWLEAHEARLRGRLGAVRIARNEEFAQAGDRLEAGDVLALIPPVAGG